MYILITFCFIRGPTICKSCRFSKRCCILWPTIYEMNQLLRWNFSPIFYNINKAKSWMLITSSLVFHYEIKYRVSYTTMYWSQMFRIAIFLTSIFNWNNVRITKNNIVGRYSNLYMYNAFLWIQRLILTWQRSLNAWERKGRLYLYVINL